MTIKLYTDRLGVELYNMNEFFFAEDVILDEYKTEGVYIVEVDSSARLNISHDTNHIKTFKIRPEQVISIIKEEK